MNSPEDISIKNLAKSIRLLLLDVDGVLTDGRIILHSNNEESKNFHVHDGIGIKLAQSAGLTVGIITSRTSSVVSERAKELAIDELVQGSQNKLLSLNKLVSKYKINHSQTAYIGDDLQDIPILESVGLPMSVNNAISLVKDSCIYVSESDGGKGAVREAVEWLLDKRGELTTVRDKLLNHYRTLQ